MTLAGAGTRTTGVVRCDQPGALNLAARGDRRVETVPEAILQEALARLQTLLE